MKILIVIGQNPYFGNFAPSNRWRTLVDGLSDLGVEVIMLITGGYLTKPEFKSMRRSGRINNVKVHYISFLFNHTLWLRRLNNYFVHPLLMTFIHRAVMRFITSNKEAIVWTDSSNESLKLAIKIKKLYPETKTFLELSEYFDIHHLNRGTILQKLTGSNRQSLFYKKAYFAYNGLALMTRTLMEHFRSLPEEGPVLFHLPMTVDLERFDKPLQAADMFRKPYIAFIGMMNNSKEGVDILIKAFAEISEKYPNHALFLIGPWHYDTPIHKKMIDELGLEKRVFWMGEYKRDEIPAIIKNADLLVLPRPDSKQSRGGFPTKLGEYLASGTPVCATRVGEIPDYLTDGNSAYLTHPGSSESLAEAMSRALSNPAEARRIGANGRKVAEIHFNKDIQARRLYEFLKENL